MPATNPASTGRFSTSSVNRSTRNAPVFGDTRAIGAKTYGFASLTFSHRGVNRAIRGALTPRLQFPPPTRPCATSHLPPDSQILRTARANKCSPPNRRTTVPILSTRKSHAGPPCNCPSARRATPNTPRTIIIRLRLIILVKVCRLTCYATVCRGIFNIRTASSPIHSHVRWVCIRNNRKLRATRSVVQRFPGQAARAALRSPSP